MRHVSLHPSQDPRHEMVPTLVNLSGMDEPSSPPYVEVIVWFTSFLNLTKQATGCVDCAPVSWFSDIMEGLSHLVVSAFSTDNGFLCLVASDQKGFLTGSLHCSCSLCSSQPSELGSPAQAGDDCDRSGPGWSVGGCDVTLTRCCHSAQL